MTQPTNPEIAELEPAYYSNPDFLRLLDSSHSDDLPNPAQRGKALLAFSTAMIWPGFGHVVAGRPGWAGTWFVLWTCIAAGIVSVFFFPWLLPLWIVLLPLGLIVQLAQLIHAAHCGRTSPHKMLANPFARFVVGTMAAALALAGYCGAIRYMQNNWFELCYSPTPSMSPAVSPGDLFLNFKLEPVYRWDIVGVNTSANSGIEHANLCKRVVGMPGDRVEITGNALLINGKPATLPSGVGPYIPVDTWNNPLSDPEPLSAANGCWGKPITLGPDEYYLLGDNSPISGDSRFWPGVEGHQPGAMPADQLCGRIVGIVWPPNRWRVFDSSAYPH